MMMGSHGDSPPVTSKPKLKSRYHPLVSIHFCIFSSKRVKWRGMMEDYAIQFWLFCNLVDTIVNISEGTGKVNENRPQKPHSTQTMK
jgi:hypothetical protein